MLKKVSLTNIHTGRSCVALVDTNTDDKALIGSGKTAVENAKISEGVQQESRSGFSFRH